MADHAQETPRRVERLTSHVPVLAPVLAALLLVAPIAATGIWDPHELRAIDLARRIALHWFGASEFELAGVENSLPSRGEVDRGELPVVCMALGLKLFGLSAWAGRLPLCLAAIVGVVATYVLVARLADRVAAALSVLVLATMPLYFVHARTMLGDGLTMAALAVAVSGLCLSLYDARTLRARLAWFALGAVGLVAGALSRGALLGVAVPALGVGLAWLGLRLSGAGRGERAATWIGSTVTVVGVASALLGALVLTRALDAPERYFAVLGFGVSPPAVRPTFDAVVHQLGHALFPWSAVLPAAFARFALPRASDGAPSEKTLGLRATLVVLVAVALVTSGFLAPYAGVLPFGAVAPLAVAVGLCFRDFDRGAPASRAFGLFAAALALLLVIDFRNFPEELLGVFGLGPLKFPEGFRDSGMTLLALGTVAGFAVAFFATQERSAERARVFDANDYLGWLRALRDLWNGNLLFGLLVVEAALLGFFAFDWIGSHVPALERFVTRGELARRAARFGFLALPLVLALVFACFAARDGVRALDRLRASARAGRFVPGRGTLAACAVLAIGIGLASFYYPALSRQLSPRESFEAYRRFARAGEPLGMIGGSALAAHYAGGGVVSFRGPEQAYRWLLESESRRFLVVRSDALATLNSRYRARVSRTGNLPVLDAHSSEILLVSNRLLPGERNENPLARYLPTQTPAPSHPLDANLGDQLDVLGWDVTDLDGRPVEFVVPGRRYEFVIHFRVVARIAGTWETFLHIDGYQRRFNGDHRTLDGRYPFALWQVGDIIADRHELELEPNFTPGTYQVYFGLYSGSRRLAVRRGAHHEDRVQGGPLVVR